MATATRVAVVGGGYAGLAALPGLLQISGGEVHLWDPSDGQQLLPELPSALVGDDAVERHVLPFAKLLAGTGVVHHPHAVVEVKSSARLLVDDTGHQAAFDWVIVAVGTDTAWPPVPGLRRHAWPFHSAADAQRLKRALAAAPRGRVLVGGGGLTGVELAGALSERWPVTLVEAADRLLPSLGPGLARYGRERLTRAGVHVRTGRPIARVDAGTVTLDGGPSVPWDVFIWAGGLAAPATPMIEGAQHDNQGYAVADPWGQVAPHVYVAGDAWLHRDGARIGPQTAQAATADGQFVAEAIRRSAAGERPSSAHTPNNCGMLVSLDPHRGVGWVVDEGLPVWGYGARLMKDVVFRQYRHRVAARLGTLRRP
ncbi:MAG: FAD-dependent oxidoreductase [Thermaerobacter sp.]|nr:FAD-dependent oxidoreductase [Thermaerobacter sp.]